MLVYLCAALVALVVLALDQGTKAYIAANLVLNAEPKPLVGDLLHLTYIRNSGGAWGMMSGHTWLLVTVTVLIMAVCIGVTVKIGRRSRLMLWAMALVLCGGVGNMIDRIFRGGEVVDFLQFGFWPSFPVFNVADIAICTGAGLLILYFVLGMVADAKKANPHNKAEGSDAEI